MINWIKNYWNKKKESSESAGKDFIIWAVLKIYILLSVSVFLFLFFRLSLKWCFIIYIIYVVLTMFPVTWWILVRTGVMDMAKSASSLIRWENRALMGIEMLKKIRPEKAKELEKELIEELEKEKEEKDGNDPEH